MEKGACLCETISAKGIQGAKESKRPGICMEELCFCTQVSFPPPLQPHHVQAFRVNLGVASKCTVVQK